VSDTINPEKSDDARQLFRYLGGEEWREYRAILAVFADTFFSEFSADDVVTALRERDQVTDTLIEAEVVADRLESLRRWGNLTASTSVGNPASLDDYYKRRHRYLITRAGQEVYDAVEGILHRIDDVSDVQSGRLRDMRRALEELQRLAENQFMSVGNDEIADLVRGVFDPHQSFSSEITQFFASINQWQSRFDLEAHEITFLAEILVGYVTEQLHEIERMARPIASILRVLQPSIEEIVSRSRLGLASRVSDAGLGDTVSVRYPAGAQINDWVHLMNWFGAGVEGRSRLDSLTRQALSAVRTLTANLTRLSRVGAGSASRRADFLRLAGFVDEAADLQDVHRLMAAAFGLFPSRHMGLMSADHDDPVSTTTSWSVAPTADVPVTLRERGERNQRGGVSPVRNRESERERLRETRQQEREAESAVAHELLAAADTDGRFLQVQISNRALYRLQRLLGAAGIQRVSGSTERAAHDQDLHCVVRRQEGESVEIKCPEGQLTLDDVELFLSSVDVSATTSRSVTEVENV